MGCWLAIDAFRSRGICYSLYVYLWSGYGFGWFPHRIGHCHDHRHRIAGHAVFGGSGPGMAVGKVGPSFLRVFMLVAALALIKPGWMTDVAGLGIFLIIGLFQLIARKRAKLAQA